MRARIRAANGSIRKQGADYLAYALLDSIVDHYYPVLESVGASIEQIEDELVDVSLKDPVRDLHRYKRTLSQIRRFIWPVRDVVNSMMHEETGLVSQGNQGLSARLLRSHGAADGFGRKLSRRALRA